MKAALFIAIIWVASYVPSFSIAQSFNGYPCTVDCSGHEAGYDWAEEKGIEDESDCGENSNSFREGCQSYVEEQEEDSKYSNDVNDEEADD